MEIEEIFDKLADHMMQGIIFHSEIAKIYDFFGLQGLSMCHTYHCYEEMDGYYKFIHYYTKHYFKLLPTEDITKPKLIPETWYKYTTMAVDGGTKRNTIKDLTEKWIKWEQETKKLYQEMRQKCIEINEVAAALYIDKYICDVSKELSHAQKQLIDFETIGYDLIEITKQQEDLYKKYTKKFGW